MQEKTKFVLYTYWRSSCSWRVRTILNLKRLDYEQVPIDLVKGEQRGPEYLKINPYGFVPSLKLEDGTIINESMAIAEYIEERYPDVEPRLLPKDLKARANVRILCNFVSANMQALQNLKVAKHVVSKYNGDRAEWSAYWNDEGFKLINNMLERTMGKHAVGDDITLADVLIMIQFRNAVQRFKLDENDYPNVKKVYDAVKEHPDFVKAYPENQPDAS